MGDKNESVVMVSQTLASRIEQIERRQEELRERMFVFFFVCLLCCFAAASCVLIFYAYESKTEYRLEKLEAREVMH
jgi:hypothetical protein